MTHSPTNWKDARRLQAWRLKQKGWSQRQIAEAMGVSAGAVSQWMKRGRDGGPEALWPRPPPGAPQRLSAGQLAQLPALLQRGPEAYGFRGPLWTRGRIAAIIQLEFGVSYHPRHVGRRCQAIHWRPHKPARRARQRDEAAISRGREDTWPALTRGRKSRAKASSSSTNRGSIPCPVSSARLRPSAPPPSCTSGGPGIISRPSAPSPQRASCTFTARTAPSTRPLGSPFWRICCARCRVAWS
jgi:transposase